MKLAIFEDELPLPATIYVLVTIAVGMPLIAYCLAHALQRDPRWILLVLTTAATTHLISVRTPLVSARSRSGVRTSSHSFFSTPADFFVLIGILFFSPEVAALVGATDGLIAFSTVTRPRRYRAWHDLSVLALIAWFVGKLFYWMQGTGAPLDPDQVGDPTRLVMSLYAVVTLHVVVNIGFNCLAIRLSTGRLVLDQVRSQVWCVMSGLVGATGAAVVFLAVHNHYLLSWLAAGPLVLIVVYRANRAFGDRIEALVAARELLQDSLDALSAYVAVLNERGRIVAMNQAWRGWHEKDRLFGSWMGLGTDYHQACANLTQAIAGAAPVLEAVRRVTEGTRARCRLDYHCAPTAPDAWFQLGLSRFESARGTRVIVSHQEVTDLKVSERRARQSEGNYRSFFEEDLTGAFVADGAGTLIDCNPAFARILGFGSPEEAMGTSLLNLFADKARAEGLLAGLADGEKFEYLEADLKAVDGNLVNVVANFTGRIGDRGELDEIRGYVFDDTRRKKLEGEVMQARKMDAVGQLAEGIAHEFNNILTVVMGCAEFLKESLREHSELAEEASLVLNAADHGSRLTRRFQVFRRDGTGGLEAVAVDDLVRRMEPMLRRVVGEGVRLETRLKAGKARLLADAAQIEQVILNLVVNARDAMPEGGELVVESRLSSDGLPLRLRVTDCGHGMSDEVRRRIFEPFYTTKQRGSGTGLGLATVRGVIQQCRGRIEVDSAPGRGSSFELQFPLEQGGGEYQPPEQWPTDSLRGSETILLVEDHAQIRGLVSRALRERGYQVVAASDGAEAVPLAESHPGPIHLLVTDIVMPRMNGWELAERIRDRLRPSPRVLFITGYANRQTDVHAASQWISSTRLEKPFTLEALLRQVRAVLDEK